MSPALVDAFAQRIAQMIVPHEVAIAYEGADFRNMKVHTITLSFSAFSCLSLTFLPFFPLLFKKKIRSSCLTLEAITPRSQPCSQQTRHGMCGALCV
jgi:hypothetical protein